VATQGRSIWVLDDLTLLHQLNTELEDKAFVLYKPRDSYRTGGSTTKEPSKTAGTNLPNGVITHFYLKDFSDKDSVSLAYTTTAGDTLAVYKNSSKDKDKKLEVKQGGNTHVWDTKGKAAEKLKGMILWWAKLDGPKAVPGTYKVHLTVNGETASQPFTILPDPRAEASVGDMQEQHEFIADINRTIDRAHLSIKKIRKIDGQLDAFMKQFKGDERVKDLLDKAKQMKTDFASIEKALYQTKNRSGQDPLNFPIRLTNKLAHLNSLVTMGDFKPTAQDIAVKQELSAEIRKELEEFDALVDSKIRDFNKAFNEMQLDYLFVED
jgi:hypothetical protein